MMGRLEGSKSMQVVLISGLAGTNDNVLTRENLPLQNYSYLAIRPLSSRTWSS